ncbi:hypothetical protein EDEG_02648 [Edhazardia aedis USNM 41457]|uniref:Uncharacterized protein n=1 Tax=Edhazardia aedis (strain USNM 41457) TaxID=1003232 RepID=J8ZTF2_EDHAE|nr:hypothetical protein EDEG_02648 [Edhazardia aedis USNM 41457]|eukprot:EJW02963.1 hypothetical protein EDEG_02648 [Edhazardia aedis USNM 41457]
MVSVHETKISLKSSKKKNFVSKKIIENRRNIKNFEFDIMSKKVIFLYLLEAIATNAKDFVSNDCVVDALSQLRNIVCSTTDNSAIKQEYDKLVENIALKGNANNMNDRLLILSDPNVKIGSNGDFKGVCPNNGPQVCLTNNEQLQPAQQQQQTIRVNYPVAFTKTVCVNRPVIPVQPQPIITPVANIPVTPRQAQKKAKTVYVTKTRDHAATEKSILAPQLCTKPAQIAVRPQIVQPVVVSVPKTDSIAPVNVVKPQRTIFTNSVCYATTVDVANKPKQPETIFTGSVKALETKVPQPKAQIPKLASKNFTYTSNISTTYSIPLTTKYPIKNFSVESKCIETTTVPVNKIRYQFPLNVQPEKNVYRPMFPYPVLPMGNMQYIPQPAIYYMPPSTVSTVTKTVSLPPQIVEKTVTPALSALTQTACNPQNNFGLAELKKLFVDLAKNLSQPKPIILKERPNTVTVTQYSTRTAIRTAVTTSYSTSTQIQTQTQVQTQVINHDGYYQQAISKQQNEIGRLYGELNRIYNLIRRGATFKNSNTPTKTIINTPNPLPPAPPTIATLPTHVVTNKTVNTCHNVCMNNSTLTNNNGSCVDVTTNGCVCKLCYPGTTSTKRVTKTIIGTSTIPQISTCLPTLITTPQISTGQPTTSTKNVADPTIITDGQTCEVNTPKHTKTIVGPSIVSCPPIASSNKNTVVSCSIKTTPTTDIVTQNSSTLLPTTSCISTNCVCDENYVHTIVTDGKTFTSYIKIPEKNTTIVSTPQNTNSTEIHVKECTDSKYCTTDSNQNSNKNRDTSTNTTYTENIDQNTEKTLNKDNNRVNTFSTLVNNINKTSTINGLQESSTRGKPEMVSLNNTTNETIEQKTNLNKPNTESLHFSIKKTLSCDDSVCYEIEIPIMTANNIKKDCDMCSTVSGLCTCMDSDNNTITILDNMTIDINGKYCSGKSDIFCSGFMELNEKNHRKENMTSPSISKTSIAQDSNLEETDNPSSNKKENDIADENTKISTPSDRNDDHTIYPHFKNPIMSIIKVTNENDEEFITCIVRNGKTMCPNNFETTVITDDLDTVAEDVAYTVSPEYAEKIFSADNINTKVDIEDDDDKLKTIVAMDPITDDNYKKTKVAEVEDLPRHRHARELGSGLVNRDGTDNFEFLDKSGIDETYDHKFVRDNHINPEIGEPYMSNHKNKKDCDKDDDYDRNCDKANKDDPFKDDFVLLSDIFAGKYD